MTLTEYVTKFAIRGACTCGRCIDAPSNPKDHQPSGHTVNLTFFQVAAKEGATAEDFLLHVFAEHLEWLDGQEHNYLEIGAAMGDQGLGLMTIGLGAVLGAWEALTPDTVMPFMDEELKKQMAGMGMVTMRYTEKET